MGSATSTQNFIYLTVRLLGLIHSTLKYTVTDTSLSLNVNTKEGDKECEYAFELDFYANVVPKAFKKCMTLQSVTFVIFKQDITTQHSTQHWSDLSKTALPYVKTDLSQLAWEGDESDDVEEDCSTNIINKQKPNECSTPPSVTMPAAPQVLWAQQSSPTERMKNIISLHVDAQDNAEPCAVMDTSNSYLPLEWRITIWT